MMAHFHLPLVLSTLCWLTIPTTTLPIDETPLRCPENSLARKAHCVCSTNYVCHATSATDKCLVGQRSSEQHPITGFSQDCTSCSCVPRKTQPPSLQLPEDNQDDASTREEKQQIDSVAPADHVKEESSANDANANPPARERAAEENTPFTDVPVSNHPVMPDPDVVRQSETGVKSFAYLKLHKVGSTTVSIAFERMAEKHRLKLCGRGDAFWTSLPCNAWTTHDTEAVMAVGGADGLRFMVGGSNAVTITLLRDPISRLLSRYYYNLAMAGEKVTRPPTYDEFADFLLKNPAEPMHYVRAFSGVALSLEASINALSSFDVVGISEELDSFMALCSSHLHVPPAHLTYKNEKVVLGKPKFEDLDPRLQAHLRAVTADDQQVYLAAKYRFGLQQQKVADFSTRLSEFKTAQARVDQSCRFTETNSQVLTGKDCYQL
eukprot:m.71308 g.71308  ORF g.71308 m.71308 type:complete len:435 (+) comp14208_c0_seq1:1901-3205(+)